MARARIENREQIPREIKRQVFYDCGKICAHCGKPIEIDGEFTVEHVIPLAKGGTNDKGNLVALCETCNTAKGDNVVEPYTYYSYLSEKRRCQLKLKFDQYMASMDYLTMKNIFPTDEFDITAHTGYMMKSGRMVFKKNKYHVAKMRPVVALAYMTEYKTHLPDFVSRCVVDSVEAMDGTGYYAMTQQDGKILFVFNAQIKPVNLTKIRDEDGGDAYTRDAILIQVFMNQSIKAAPAHCVTLHNTLTGIMKYIRDGLAMRTCKGAIDLLLETPNGDMLGMGTLSRYPEYHPESWILYVQHAADDEDSEHVICGIRGIFSTGGGDLEYRYDSETGFVDIDEHRAGIEARLKSSESSKAIAPPEKVKHGKGRGGRHKLRIR